MRELRSKTGASSIRGNGKCRPCGPNRNGAKQKADAHWKVGESGTNSGQTVTGTQANRSSKTTGNESSTCRDIVLARREAQSKHGKSAIKQNPSAASLARRGDPDLSSKEIALRVRELRSKTGASSIKGNGKCLSLIHI